MIQTIYHTDGTRVLWDNIENVYYRLPEIVGKVQIGSKFFDYFDTIQEFKESEPTTAIVPVFCSSVQTVKKRTKVSLISGLNTYEFMNVERVNDEWLRNEIETMQKNKGYFVFFEKVAITDNEVLIKKCKLIRDEKSESGNV